MEVIIKIIGLALVVTICVIIVKQTKPELAMLVGVAGSVILLFYIIDLLQQVFGLFDYILQNTGLDSDLFLVLLKIVGVGYLTEFGANICSDAGNSQMSSKVLLAGKLSIFLLAIPIIKNLIDIIIGLMP